MFHVTLMKVADDDEKIFLESLEEDEAFFTADSN